MLSNKGFCLRSLCNMFTNFSTGGKFQLVSNFTDLNVLTAATCSYVLLYANKVSLPPQKHEP